jgi:hypothetical protein
MEVKLVAATQEERVVAIERDRPRERRGRPVVDLQARDHPA